MSNTASTYGFTSKASAAVVGNKVSSRANLVPNGPGYDAGGNDQLTSARRRHNALTRRTFARESGLLNLKEMECGRGDGEVVIGLIPNSHGSIDALTETWSDEARAASAAARAAKAKGGDWKKAASQAFSKANPKAGDKALAKRVGRMMRKGHGENGWKPYLNNGLYRAKGMTQFLPNK